jgi:hypothetical protein
VDRITTLVRWVQAESVGGVEIVRESVEVVLIDPSLRTIERAKIARSMQAIERLVGAKVVLAFCAPGGDRVYAAAGARGPRWRKDDAEFVGRCAIVGFDAADGIIDAAAPIGTLRRDVRFAAEDSARWTRHRDVASRASQGAAEGNRAAD